MTDKPMTVTIEDQLYSALKEIYEVIDHNNNPKLENEEYVKPVFKYSGELQAKIRRALARKEIHDRSDKSTPAGMLENCAQIEVKDTYMTKKELIEALQELTEVDDDAQVIASSEQHNDIYEIKSIKNLGDGVLYLEIDNF